MNLSEFKPKFYRIDRKERRKLKTPNFNSQPPSTCRPQKLKRFYGPRERSTAKRKDETKGRKRGRMHVREREREGAQTREKKEKAK